MDNCSGECSLNGWKFFLFFRNKKADVKAFLIFTTFLLIVLSILSTLVFISIKHDNLGDIIKYKNIQENNVQPVSVYAEELQGDGAIGIEEPTALTPTEKTSTKEDSKPPVISGETSYYDKIFIETPDYIVSTPKVAECIYDQAGDFLKGTKTCYIETEFEDKSTGEFKSIRAVAVLPATYSGQYNITSSKENFIEAGFAVKEVQVSDTHTIVEKVVERNETNEVKIDEKEFDGYTKIDDFSKYKSDFKIDGIFIDPDISACGSIVSAGVYTLTQDLVCPTTGITVGTNNVEINGQGYTITYANTSTGVGLSLGNINQTVRNLNLNQSTAISPAANSHGIASGDTNSSYINVTINTYGATSRAIIFSVARNVSLSNSRLFSNDSMTLYYTGNNGPFLVENSNITSTTKQSVYIDATDKVNLRNNIMTSLATDGTGSFVIASDARGNNSLLYNNTINSLNGEAVNIGAGINQILDSNTITTTTGNGIVLSYVGAANDTVLNNIVRSDSGIAINIQNLQGTLVQYNRIISNGTGIQTLTSSGNIVKYNNITSYGLGTNNYGITFQGSNNTAEYNNINISTTNSGTSALRVVTATSVNSTFNSNTLITPTSSIDFILSTANTNSTKIINQRINNYSLTGVGGRVSFENTTYGKIEFTQAINGSGNDLFGSTTAKIRIGNNSAYVNATHLGLNRSANVTLYGLPTNFAQPYIARDGVLCSDCYNFTSLNAGTVVFNVSGWSNYSIMEGGSAPSGPIINFTNPTYANHTTTTNRTIPINFSISKGNLDSVIFNWNGTNTSLYDQYTYLFLQLNNNTLVGDTESGPVDLSKYSNNGSFADNAKWNCTAGVGINGCALDLDGSGDRVTFTDSVAIVDQMTVSTWVNARSWTANAGFLGNWDSPSFTFGIQDGDGLLRLRVRATGNEDQATSTTPLSLNEWHHVAGTWNGTVIKIFVDGNLEGEATVTGTMQNSPPTPWIGSLFSGSYYYDGLLSDMQLINVSLTDQQMYELYFSNLQKRNSTYWDLFINQSKTGSVGLGTGNYTYSGFATETGSSENSTEQRVVNILVPTISIEKVFPTTNQVNVTQYQWFNVSVNVTCLVADCGQVNLTLDPFTTGDRELQYELESITLISGSSDSGSVSNTNDSDVNAYHSASSQPKWSFNWTEEKSISYIQTYWSSGPPWGLAPDGLNISYWDTTLNDWVTPAGWDNSSDLFPTSAWHIQDLATPIRTKAIRVWVTNDEFGAGGYVGFAEINISGQNGGEQPKSGIISMNSSATPFWTSTTNPYNLTLTAGQSVIVTWTVNGTGDPLSGNNHTFFAYANITSDPSISDITDLWNVTISPIPEQKINLNLLNPITNQVNVSQGNWFNVTVNVTCLMWSCENVNTTLARYNASVVVGTDISPHNMTDDTSPAPYVASASTAYFPASNAFDPNEPADYWLTDSSVSGWLAIDLGQNYTLYNYGIQVNNQPEPARAPKDWTFEGSQNGTTWQTLDTVTGQTDWGNAEIRTFSLDSYSPFRYYRVNITDNNGDGSYTQIAHLYLNQTAVGNLLVTVPTSSQSPFYTNTTNPFNYTLGLNESKIITWFVNATGDLYSNWTFLVYSNITSNMTISNITSSWNVSIVEASSTTNYYLNASNSLIVNNEKATNSGFYRIGQNYINIEIIAGKIKSAFSSIFDRLNIFSYLLGTKSATTRAYSQINIYSSITGRLEANSLLTNTINIYTNLFARLDSNLRLNNHLTIYSNAALKAGFLKPLTSILNIYSDITKGYSADRDITHLLSISSYTNSFYGKTITINDMLSISSNNRMLSSFFRNIFNFINIISNIAGFGDIVTPPSGGSSGGGGGSSTTSSTIQLYDFNITTEEPMIQDVKNIVYIETYNITSSNIDVDNISAIVYPNSSEISKVYRTGVGEYYLYIIPSEKVEQKLTVYVNQSVKHMEKTEFYNVIEKTGIDKVLDSVKQNSTNIILRLFGGIKVLAIPIISIFLIVIIILVVKLISTLRKK